MTREESAPVAQRDEWGPCQHCGLDHDFILPPELAAAAHSRDVVLFVGAGVSTEAPETFPFSIYDMARAKLGGLGVSDSIPFPELMQMFEDQYGRAELVALIASKFDRVDGFRRARQSARRFHRELATMPYLEEIVTTNWDTYFEEECGATPYVTGDDVAMWKSARRRVLKIHGSVMNPGSLVATQTDYTSRLQDLSHNTMGGLLRTLLATKTVVFIGYSLTDWNFRTLYEELRRDLGEFAPKAYVVTPHESPAAVELGLDAIPTSGVKFLSTLKRELGNHCFVDDSAYDAIEALEDRVLDAVELSQSVAHSKYPAIFYNWMYHDGIRDACDRVLWRRKTGEYSDVHSVQAKIRMYADAQTLAYDEARFHDYAYIEGYLNCLLALVISGGGEPDLDGLSVEQTPLHFFFGSETDLLEEEDFAVDLRASQRRSRRTRDVARRAVEGLPPGMVITHGPTLRMGNGGRGGSDGAATTSGEGDVYSH